MFPQTTKNFLLLKIAASCEGHLAKASIFVQNFIYINVLL